MGKMELLVAVKDKDDDAVSGHKRSKRGDIIAIRPAPWNWGTEERKLFLIVPIKDDLTEDEISNLAGPLFENGMDLIEYNAYNAQREAATRASFVSLNLHLFNDIEAAPKMLRAQFEKDLHDISLQYPKVSIAAKRKFKINIESLKSFTKISDILLEDVMQDYQPLKNNNIAIPLFATDDIDFVFDKKEMEYIKKGKS